MAVGLCASPAYLQSWGAVVPHLPVPPCGSAHHPLRTHLLLAVHAALPVSEWQELVQVSHLLRGRPHGRPEEVKQNRARRRSERRKMKGWPLSGFSVFLQRGCYGDQAVCGWWCNHHAPDAEGEGVFGGHAQLSVGEGGGASLLRRWETHKVDFFFRMTFYDFL